MNCIIYLRTSSACYCLSQCGLLIAHLDLVSELVLALNFWHLSLLSYTRLVPVCLISPVPITWLNFRVNTAIYFLSSKFGYLFTYVKLSITYGLKLFRFVKNRCRSQTLFRFYLIFLVKMVTYCVGYASKNVNLCCL